MLEKRTLSGSASGGGISINADSVNPTLIHSAVNDSAKLDEIWLYAVNNSTSSVTLTLHLGSTNAKDTVNFKVDPTDGLVTAISGLVFNSNLQITAHASTTDVINVFGFVNRFLG